MPSQPNDPHVANDPLPEDSSSDQAETAIAPPGHQTITRRETPSPYDSDSDDNERDEPLLDLNNINKMDITTLRYMLIKLIIRKRAASAIYKKPSRRPNLYEELSSIKDALRETPKLTTKNWYSWNQHFRDILSTWSPALKHLDGITKPGDRKFDRKLDCHLCLILPSSTKSTGPDNVNYLFLRPAKAEPWRLHELYNHLKNYLTKMVYIAE
ncbi:hypothetical protein NDA11_001403 [Ustilago hordei]|uniref:Uncharacterized protein n=1 Tax=Ustilago hordei TaxID=120017 RepID=I2FMT7_USTHO|nr:uncharacterized protein UHO2_04806 [Ustilago hordei]KAJ1041862.1 hypothetical protein NDA10_001274 [Ustilago hordei]KAJ1575563.1 hypothetical protein NDA15_006220 [Ustilago hordei]KAJ1577299.1 hypothetical protein NDA12_005137 [Ustilago hordei]KAJ1595079.1 hypothetical protein NDA11_001403 [Ustilago hordei]KAJ1597161.1 hypothetical protein NDA14_007549 [Ustilago hordei]